MRTECLVCGTTSFRHGFISQVESLTDEPKLPILIRKHHLRTSNGGMWSCFIEVKSIMYKKCIIFKATVYAVSCMLNVLCRVERDIV